MRVVLLSLLIVIISLGYVMMPPGQGDWVTDYEEAFVMAKRENKHVLINFTGSDWCGWCQKLDREVFNQGEFREYAKKNLVLLKLDFPRRTVQPHEVKIKNQGYAKRFAIAGFPTILIAKANQNIILRTGYKSGGPDKYIKHIEQAIK